MFDNNKIVVVLPAYNAEKTLERVYSEIPFDIVDEIILVDDCSLDNTSELALNLGIKHIIRHQKNLGYGGNQKTCYNKALEIGADIVIMLHPDYQYTPRLIRAMVAIITSGHYQVVFGSRILGGSAIRGGMPLYKYFFNRLLTLIQNILSGQKLSEYHTGYRAYTANVLRAIPFIRNSNNFVFDNEVIAQIFSAGYEISEITCPTKYFSDGSSISFWPSIIYGFGVLRVSLFHFLHRYKIYTSPFLRL
jgi:glycosyltransferase involved in cell wall biosynthesis